jgi:hypothetical protein
MTLEGVVTLQLMTFIASAIFTVALVLKSGDSR